MDNLRTLLERKEYQLVLDLTKNTNDPEGIFIRASAFLSLSKAQDAMDLIEEKRDILWGNNPLKLMKTNFELRFILNQFDEAYDDASYFSSLPYVSQEVEEYLHSLGKLIRYNERQASLKVTYSEDDIRKILSNGKDSYELMAILSSFNDAKISYFLDEIKNLLERDIASIVKTYALMLLVKIKYPGEISFAKNGQSYVLKPKDISLPYQGKEAILLSDEIQKEVKDPSMFNIAKNILNNYTFELYPTSIFEKYPERVYLISFVNLAHQYLQQDFDSQGLEEKYSIKHSEVLECAQYISKILSEAEKIKV